MSPIGGVQFKTKFGEYDYSTEPLNNDTDNDTILDGLEVYGDFMQEHNLVTNRKKCTTCVVMSPKLPL